MKLFQSIFGAERARERYPESLIEQAIERATDGTDARLRLLPGYRKRLRAPIIGAIDHVVAIVDGIGAPVAASASQYSDEPRLRALFSAPREMLAILARDAALKGYLASADGRGAGAVTALLLADRVERQVLGMDLVGDQVRKDVRQVAVSFSAHRLLDPSIDEEDCRRQWKRRAFDHLLTLALARIAAMQTQRADLKHQHDLLRRKLEALERGGWSFAATEQAPTDPAALHAELEALKTQLSALGADHEVLKRHLELLAEVMNDAPHQLHSETIELWLDAMNIQRDPDDASAQRIGFQELRNALNRRAVLLPLRIDPADLPATPDWLAEAQRHLQ